VLEEEPVRRNVLRFQRLAPTLYPAAVPRPARV